MKNNKQNKGFSLPEVIIVCAIVAIMLPGILKLLTSTGKNFIHVQNLLKTEKKLIEFKENFRIYCWKSLVKDSATSAEFRRTGDPAAIEIKGQDIYNNLPDYSKLDITLQPLGLDTALTQRDSLFLPKGQTGVAGQWAMIRYDPVEHTLSWYPTATDLTKTSLVLNEVYRPDYDPDTNINPTSPVIYVALNSLSLIDCVQIRCKIRIPQSFGNSKYITFITTARLNIVA